MLDDYARWVLEPSLPAHPTAPTSSYFICSMQRSGTWLLASLLASTGVVGRPHEYFEAGTEQASMRRWEVDSFADYVSRVLECGTTENGVFGSNVMWPNFGSVLTRLHEHSPALAGADLIEQYFPSPRFVLLQRDDVVAQAVSWAKAIQTGHFHRWNAVVQEPEFEFEQIEGLAGEIERGVAAWRVWFAENEIEPLTIRFEDLVADPQQTASDVLGFLEIDLPKGVVASVQTRKASDSVDADWVARYRERKERVGP